MNRFFSNPRRTRGEMVRLDLEAVKELEWSLSKMVDQVAEINTIIDQITSKLATVKTDVGNLLAKVAAANAANQPVDLSDVETRLQGISDGLTAIDEAANPAPAPTGADATGGDGTTAAAPASGSDAGAATGTGAAA